MQLTYEENQLLYRLYPALMVYANRQLQIIPSLTDSDQWIKIDANLRWNLREALFDQVSLIDAFIQSNPCGFSAEELEVVNCWRHFVRGNFILLRHLKKYSLFLDTQEKGKVYGVIALVDPLEYFYPYPPVYLKTLLLPFKEKIIYDGLINVYRITFGGGIKQGLNESYKKAKARYGIVHRADQLIVG